jgi:hypothetical protein
MTETQFKDFFEHGVVQSIRIVGIPCRVQIASVPAFCVAIQYQLTDGQRGLVETKRGVDKVYRVETALNLLRKLGLKDVVVDLASLGDYRQQGLPL